MITVHHLNNSRSQRILWLLEELDISYQIKKYQRNPKTQLAPEELKMIHPLGKSPVITDGESTIAESGAIVDFIIKNYGAKIMSQPTLGKDYEQYVYWTHFAEGSLMPPFVMKLIFDKIKYFPMPFFVKPVAKMIANTVLNSYVNPTIKGNLDFVENYLKHHKYFCGEKLSGADIMMMFPLEAGLKKLENNTNYPEILKYIKRMQSRDAYKAAIEMGGPYDYI